MISFCKYQCIILRKRSYYKAFNAERIVKIFRLGIWIVWIVHIWEIVNIFISKSNPMDVECIPPKFDVNPLGFPCRKDAAEVFYLL